ncbi:bric-a-brac protein [Parasponia andersonii]|uniref:Bric-a-brac protein n=1 Tax=Parasponia andersonii TaxID=3476 RepID=A0A2P5B4K8_PARAD|nr:bric-a-brac protein [Parasponia andersonii]
MVPWSYPQTPRQLGATAVLFVAGVSLMGVGAHLAYSNVEAQQARVKARTDFVKDRLRRLLDDID